VEAARKDRKAAAAADGRALAAAEGRDFAEAVVETVREPLLVLDADRTVRKVNRAFRSTFHVEDGQIVGKQLGEVLDGHFDTPAFRKVLEHVLMDDAVEDFEVEQEFPKVGRRRLLVNARRLQGDDERPPLVLMALAEPAVTRAR